MALAMEKTLSAEFDDGTPSTFLGEIELRHGGDISISGTWSGTLSLQAYWETTGTWKTVCEFTSNAYKAIDSLTRTRFRACFLSGNYTSGDCLVAIKSRSF